MRLGALTVVGSLAATAASFAADSGPSAAVPALSGPLPPSAIDPAVANAVPPPRSDEPKDVARRAASKTAYADAGAADVLEILKDHAAEIVGRPAVRGLDLPAGAEVESYSHNDTVARVTTENDKELLLSSTMPMRTKDEDGDLAPVDLGLVRDGQGHEPVNPFVPTRFPDDLHDGLDVGGIVVRFDGMAAGAGAGERVGDSVIWPNTMTDTDIVANPVPTGAEFTATLRSADSPEDITVDFDLPQGSTARLAAFDDNPGGVALVDAEQKAVGSLSAPVAWDAEDRPIPSEWRREGDRIVLHVDHHSEDVAYPIVVDPIVNDDRADAALAVSGMNGKPWEWVDDTPNHIDPFYGNGGWGQGMYARILNSTRYYDGTTGAYWKLSLQDRSARILQLHAEGVRHDTGVANASQAPAPTCTFVRVLWNGNLDSELSSPQLTRCDTYTNWIANAGNWVELRGHRGNVAQIGIYPAGAGNRYYFMMYVWKLTVAIQDDDTPATPSVDGPSPNWAPAPSAPATIHAADAGLGIKRLGLRVDYVPGGTGVQFDWQNAHPSYPDCIVCDRTASQSRTLNLANGDHTIDVASEDPAGNTSAPSPAIHVRVDAQKPTGGALTATAEADGTTRYAGDTYTAKFTAADAHSGVASMRLTIDGGSAETVTTGCQQPLGCAGVKTGTFTFTMPAGTHTLEATATDLAGNVSTLVTRQVTGSTLPAANDRIGLERFWDYDTVDTGAGSQLLVNADNGNLVWHHVPVVNPGRGLSTFVNVDYNSLDRPPRLGMQQGIDPLQAVALNTRPTYNVAGRGVSIGVSGPTRLNEPLSGVGLADVRDGLHGSVSGLPSDIGNDITMTDADGTRHHFIRDSGNGQKWIAPPGVHLTLRRFATTGAERWVMTRPDGVAHFFNSLGYLTRTEDRNGNRLQYTYEYFDLLTGASGASQCASAAVIGAVSGTPTNANGWGLRTSFGVSSASWSARLCTLRATKVTDAGARDLTLSYQARTSADQAQIDGAATSGTATLLSRLQSASAQLADFGRLIAPPRLSNVTDHAGRELTFDYGSADELMGLTEVANAGQLAPAGDAARRWKFEYLPSTDATRPRWLNRVVEDRGSGSADPATTVTPQSHPGTAPSGEPTVAQVPDTIADRRNKETNYDFTAYGSATTTMNVTDARGKVWAHRVDQFGRPTRITDPLGHSTDLEWDNGGAQDRRNDLTRSATGVVRNSSGAITDLGAPVRMTYEPTSGRLATHTDYPQGDDTQEHRDAGRTTTLSYTASSGKPALRPASDPVSDFVVDLTEIKQPRTAPGSTAKVGWKFEVETSTGNVTSRQDQKGGPKALTHYTAEGLVDQEVDELGNTTTYDDFDGSGLPRTVIDPLGNPTADGYDDVPGQESPSPANHRWLYRYDTVGNVVSVSDPRNGSAATDPVPSNQFTTRFVYDAFDRAIQQVTPKDSANGAYVTENHTYDRNGNQLSATNPGTGRSTSATFSATDQPLTVTQVGWSRDSAPDGNSYQPRNEVTTLSYDDTDLLASSTSPKGRTGVQPGGGEPDLPYTTEWRRDDAGRVVAEAQHANNDAVHIRSLALDARGNVIGETDPRRNDNKSIGAAVVDTAAAAAGPTTGFRALRYVRVFDLADQMTRETEWPSSDDLVSVSQRTDFVYDLDGNVTQRILPRNFTDRPTGFGDTVAESYTYDHRDQLIESVDAYGAKTARARRADGLVTAVTSARGVEDGSQTQAGTYKYFTQSTTYDAAGRVTSRSVPYAPGQYGRTDGDFSGWKVTYARDGVGNPISITDARGKTFANGFLDGGQLAWTDRPSWWQMSWSGGEGGAPEAGRRFEDPTLSDAPPVGGPALAERAQPLTDAAAPGQAQPRTTDQGKFGEVLAAGGPEWLPRLGRVAFSYDDDGRLTRVATDDPDDADPAVKLNSRIDYDPRGRVVGTTQPFTVTAGATRTGGGDPIPCETGDGRTQCDGQDPGKYPSDVRVVAQRYNYDLDGNQVLGFQLGENTWHVDTTYDSYGRVQHVEAPGAADVPSNGDWGGAQVARRTTSYSYDLNNNVTGRSTPGGGDFTYVYDGYDRLTEETDPEDGSWVYAYDAGDNVVSESPPNMASAPSADRPNYRTLHTYDAVNRLQSTQSPLMRVGSSDSRQTTFYTYWPDSSLRRINAPGAADVIDETPQPRLTEYDYDGRGLRSRETRGRLDATDSVFMSGSRSTLTEYDANGNVRRTVDPSGVDVDTDGGTQTFTPKHDDSYSVNLANATNVLAHAAVREYIGAPGDAGEVTNIWLRRANADSTDDTAKVNQKFTYDDLGRMTRVYSPGAERHTTYDHYANGWIASATDFRSADGANAVVQTDTATYKYDPQGNQTLWKLDHGNSSDPARDVVRNVRSYWPSGELRRRMGTIGAAEVDPDQASENTTHRSSTSYWYNKNGSLTAVRDTDHDTSTQISLDAAERRTIVRQVLPSCGDAQQHACGDWQKNRDTAFAYDRNGNVVDRKTGGSAGNDFTSDTNGTRTFTHFAYDRANRQTIQASWEPGRAGNPTVTDTTCAQGAPVVSNVRCDRTNYYPSGQPAARRNANGGLEELAYNEFGQTSERRRSTHSGELADFTAFRYDGRGNRTRDERGSTYEYNARDQMTRWVRAASMSKPGGPDKASTNVRYAFNPDGSLQETEDSWDATGQNRATTTTYHYKGERLDYTDIAKTGTTTKHDFFWSNIQGSTVEIKTQSTDDPETIDFSPRSGGTGGGDCDELPAAQPNTSYMCYDEFNRLVHQRGAGAIDEQRFVYDGFDRRDRRRDRYHAGAALSGTTTGYAYVGTSPKIARESVGEPVTGFTTHSFDFDAAGRPLGVGQRRSTGTFQPFHAFALDANGSVMALEDSVGDISAANSYIYDPFGALDPDLNSQVADSDAAQNPLRFEGFNYDSATKTYAVQARDYHPDSGRFLQADRYEAAGSDLGLIADALTANRFTFGANPVNDIELDGHDKQDSWQEFEGGRADESGQGGNCHKCGDELKKRPKDVSTKDYVISKGGTYTTTGGSECSKQGCHPAPATRRPNPKVEYWDRGIPAPPKAPDAAARAAGLHCLDASKGGRGCAVWQTDTPEQRNRALDQLSWLIPVPEIKGLQIGGRGVSKGGKALLGRLGMRGGRETEPAAPRAIGFAEGVRRSALESEGRLQHATRHLIDDGVLPPWKGKTSPELFREKLAPILERPLRTYDDDLSGVATKVFTGQIDGHDVAIHVFKAGKLQGQIGTAVVPRGAQRSKWGF